VVSSGAGGDGGRGGGAGDGGTAALETRGRGQMNGQRRWRRGLLDEDEDELPDPGLLRTYIGVEPLARVCGWTRC